ncbi:acyl-CoA thioesterase [Aquirhabdus parva]|uniref:Acyl-CoA thioesterase n=1 Tax=Aquirhabdus parva TaxID=2283318 RepID=A0A345P6F8_9GAMM|nr:thioesterase family protein [Aquirhabdus parva]AXI02867.1 acyl-CoA thioesterase [Aquirhabdus parva]
MFNMTVLPRFYETDAFGHINNTVIAGWFEAAREPVFRIFTPELDIKKLTLILARIEIDFVAQTHYGQEVILKTGIERVGNSSFVVVQEAWQSDVLVAKGKAVQVYFDFDTQKSDRIPDAYRQKLEALIP